MSKTLIGLIANERPSSDNLPWSYVPSGFVKGVQRAGGTPLIIPISQPDQAVTYVSMVDKIILIGGQNVNPSLYGEKLQTDDDDFFKERDDFEMAIISEAIRLKKPIFSVCRGTQLMNVALGGSLHQNIENHWQDNPADYLSQEMTLQEGTALASIYGNKTTINSFHHQSIKHLASDLKIIAQDPTDGTIEAVVSTNPMIHFLGVQWHPEFLIDSRKEDQELFNFVVNEL